VVGGEDEEEEEEEDDDEGQGTLRFGTRDEEVEYDDDDDDDDKAAGRAGDDDGAKPESSPEDEDGDQPSSPSSPSLPRAKHLGASATTAVPTFVADHPAFRAVKPGSDRASVEIVLRTRASQGRLLMVQLAEAAAEKCVVRASNGIAQAYVVDGKQGSPVACVQTDGCNLHELWELGHGVLDLTSIKSNDIWAIHQTYGVEAARRTIVGEIANVFGAYGISVDPRHLGLVADFMTYQGGFRGLNRIGMGHASSPLLRMSFETTGAFLTEAALANETDALTTPSARLVMGQPIACGTGAMRLMTPIPGMSPEV
jgi:DNA-directed RNA polymerase I subunit RPA1